MDPVVNNAVYPTYVPKDQCFVSLTVQAVLTAAEISAEQVNANKVAAAQLEVCNAATIACLTITNGAIIPCLSGVAIIQAAINESEIQQLIIKGNVSIVDGFLETQDLLVKETLKTNNLILPDTEQPGVYWCVQVVNGELQVVECECNIDN